jgi:hypothetical protein
MLSYSSANYRENPNNIRIRELIVELRILCELSSLAEDDNKLKSYLNAKIQSAKNQLENI